MTRTLLTLMPAAALLLSCEGTISNAIFERDAEFLEALPSTERHSVDVDASVRAGTLPSDAPSLLRLTVDIGGGVNAFIDELLSVVDYVRTLPPTSRGRGTRTWGPYAFDELGGAWIRLDIERTEGTHYAWAFSVAAEEQGDWTEYFWGEHLAGTSVAAGTGSFFFDYGVPAELCGDDVEGLISAVYDHRDGKEVEVDLIEITVEGIQILDGTYWFLDDGVEGQFEYVSAHDLYAPDEDSSPETVVVRSRWTHGVGGRSDATALDGDLDDLEYRMSQCWDADGHGTWDDDNLWGHPDEPPAGDCAYATWEDLSHLDTEW